MGKAEEIAALEAMTPWSRDDFRAGLAALAGSTAAAARAFAADVQVLSRLAAQVPRCRGDETGGTPWTSFRREVAVARSMSDQAAGTEIRTALRLTSTLPHTLHLLQTGRIPVARARVFVEELTDYDDELAGQLDADLADRAAQLAPWRIRQQVRRAAQLLDPDSSALRTARRTADRSVTLQPLTDGQACVVLTGPAVPLTRWHATLDTRARALRAAGDPRHLDALRFDLAVSTFPCATHSPADATRAGASAVVPTQRVPTQRVPARRDDSAPAATAAGLRLTGVEAASTDCRRSRPVQATIVVPVETALGLSHEPGWLDGYGWIDAPTSRLLLLDAELRRACADRTTGQLLDLDSRDVRPPPTPTGVRTALLELTGIDTTPTAITLTDTAWRTEPQHDPSPALRAFTTLRDRTCDGPTQTDTPAARCDSDHATAHPHGPTAAWNLASRARRTHQLKHYGWTPLRTATATIWTSPAGQLVEVPHSATPPPGADRDPSGRQPALPDPDQLTNTDADQLTAPTDSPPRLPAAEQQAPTDWSWLDGSDAAPF